MTPSKTSDQKEDLKDDARSVFSEAPPFVQISHAVHGPDGQYDLRALDKDGRVWRYVIHATRGGCWCMMSTLAFYGPVESQ